MNTKRSLKVLVADYDKTMLEIVSALFESMGCRVKLASRGSQALQAISTEQFDLLVTDFEMPDLNGYQLATAVKADSPQTKVLIMTGMHQSDVAAEVKSGLADGWLFKPIHIETVTHFLDKMS